MESYFQEIQQLLQIISEEEQQVVSETAKIIADKLTQGGILQLFGCGHSHLIAQEAFYRAGGLVPVRPIMLEPVMLHSGALTSSKNEKDPMLIAKHKDILDFQANDVLIVISTSGRNAVPIDVATFAKQSGVFVISLQSLNYSKFASRHKSKKRLEEVVDLILNTHIPIGDGILEKEGIQYGPASTVVGVTILNALISQVIEQIAIYDEELPVFGSSNITTSHSKNDDLIKKYSHRIQFN